MDRSTRSTADVPEPRPETFQPQHCGTGLRVEQRRQELDGPTVPGRRCLQRLASDTVGRPRRRTTVGCQTALTRVTAPMPSLEKKKRNQCVTCLDMHKAPPGRIDDADLNGGCLIQRRSRRLIGWENRDREKNPPGGELRLRWEKVQNPLKTHTVFAAERD